MSKATDTASPTRIPPAPPSSRVRVTLEGLAWVLLALLLLYQGWLRSVNLVALLAAFLIGLWLLNFLWVLSRGRLRYVKVRRRVEGPVFAGQPFTVALQLQNDTPVTFLGLRVTDEDRASRHGYFLPMLKPRATVEYFSSAILQRRGRHIWGELEISTSYPFGLFRRSVRIQESESVIALPRMGQLHTARLRRLLTQLPQAAASTQKPVPRHAGAQTDFHGLREFRSGDSPRWIHWRTSARVGSLMVREFEEPPVDHLVVILDPWLPDRADRLREQLLQIRRANQETIRLLLAAGPAPPPAKRLAKEAALAKKELPYRQPLEALELAVSLCASVCWEWCRHAGARLALGIAGPQPSVFVTETGTRHVFPLLEELALTEGGPEVADEKGLIRLDLAGMPRGPVLLITTRPSPLVDLLAAQLRRPVLALDVTQQEVGDLFELGGAFVNDTAHKPGGPLGHLLAQESW